MKTNYANLDMLRSLAVLSVVAQHLWHQCVNFHLCSYDAGVNQRLHNLSFTGVMFFFVHTCLVLMLSMDRMQARHRGRDFLIRRAFRIYPLCWATILLALASGLTDQPGGNFHNLGWRGVAANLLLAQNMLRSFPSVVGPLWSLPWEVQMYIVLPAFFVFLKRFDRLSAVLALWLISTLVMTATTQPALPRMLHGAIFPPMFIGGMVTYPLMNRRNDEPNRRPLPAWAWPFFILSLFAVQGLLVGEHSTESPLGSMVDAGICLTLALAIPAFGELKARWIVRPVQQMARYSDGIYLLHVPALILVMRCLPGLTLALKVCIFLFITALLSFVSFQLLENPMIELGKRLTQSARSPGVFNAPESIGLNAKLEADFATNSRLNKERKSLVCNQAEEILSSTGAME
jgi:peptidoglycan/LPS O-acetylase OafA/YrhL